MNDRILKLCNDVLEVGLGGNGEDVDCSDIDCAKCPFIDIGDCGDINEHHIKIAEEFIKNNMNNRELTFREVITQIKEDEIWESEYREIFITNSGGILISNKNGTKSDCYLFPLTEIFKLQRKQYTFEEAFKAYEEGKEIESCNYRYKKINGEDGFYSKVSGEWVEDNITFNCEEIRSSWYINY